MSQPPFPAPEEPVVTPVAAEEYPFWGYQDLVLLIGFALPSFAAAFAAVQLAARLIPGEMVLPAVGVLALQFLFYGFWFLCLYGLIRFRYGKPFWVALAWVKPLRGITIYTMAGPALAVTIALIGVALNTPEIDMPMKQLLGDRFSLLLVGAFAVTLGPLCEELAFRGFFLPLLARSFGPVIGVLVTALVFSLMHGPQYAWSWRHIVLITVAGAVFGVVRLRSGSTAAATLMHATYNLTFFLGYIVQWENLRM